MNKKKIEISLGFPDGMPQDNKNKINKKIEELNSISEVDEDKLKDLAKVKTLCKQFENEDTTQTKKIN